jgi:hypothetical protein
MIADVLEGQRAWWVEHGCAERVLPTLPDACVGTYVLLSRRRIGDVAPLLDACDRAPGEEV